MKQFLFLLAFCITAFSQPVTVVLPQPDCQIVINLSTVLSTTPTAPNAGFNNITGGCSTWAMTIAVSGFSSATVALQSAPNVAGVPGTWTTFAGGSILSPAPHVNNPITTAAQDFVWINGYNPWVRVQLTAATGSGVVNGLALGWRLPSASANGTGSEPTSVQISGNFVVLSGQQAVTGTAVALPANASKTVCVSASITNTIQVYVGPAGITTSTGFWLAPGQSTCQPLENVSLLYVVASTTGASISWIATN
jgi:hypothetical protein